MIIPRSTYRVQFTPDFTFDHAAEILEYLHHLGISHLYASPIFQSRPGSSHGYDVIDPTCINPELGGEPAFLKLSDQMREYPLYWLQDIVPNHMAYDAANPLLFSILENGPLSPYYDYFDIDWDHPYTTIHGRVLAPFLGQFYGRALEQGEIRLVYDELGLGIRYYDLRLPLRIDTYTEVFTRNLSALKKHLGKHHPEYIQFLGILYMFRNQPEAEDRLLDVDGHNGFVKQLLWDLYHSSPPIREYIQSTVECMNGQIGDPSSFDVLDQLLQKQYFQLSYWKVASEEINYKRFFNVNGLISLHVESEKVFQHTHKLIAHYLRTQRIHGLRIDHIDGLYHPELYLSKLRQLSNSSYTVIEKILEGEEKLPEEWLTEGTTGYDFMNKVCGIFVDTTKHREFTRLYANYSGVRNTTEDLMYEKKRLIIRMHLSGELDNLARQLKVIASHYRYSSDLTFSSLKEAIEEVMVYFPIYRTYVSPGVFSVQDHNIIRRGINRAAAENIKLRQELEFLQNVLLLNHEEHLPENIRNEWMDFVMRFQQFTGPLMAKGQEDTVYYIFNRLICLNEVGGNPGIFGYPVQDFHRYNQYKQAHWPFSLNATSTHDTKRGEDNRMRLAVLSEIPSEWNEKIRYWSLINRPHKKLISGRQVPSRNEEYFLYQTLIGSWPLDQAGQKNFTQRIEDYIIKAVREAKVHTAWIEPDEEYENAYLSFIRLILDESTSPEFLHDFRIFVHNLAFYGIYNSLAQVLVKSTVPGIPDFYQGSEYWDFSLVDPDNRRPVDYAQRHTTLQEIRRKAESFHPEWLYELLLHYPDARIKQYLVYQALRLRHEYPDLLEQGQYLPLEVSGLHQESILAYQRSEDNITLIVILPRLLTRVIAWRTSSFAPLGREAWADTCVKLPADSPQQWTSYLDNRIVDTPESRVPLSEAAQFFPFIILLNSAPAGIV